LQQPKVGEHQRKHNKGILLMALSDKLLQKNNSPPSSYQQYLMTTDNPTNEGYAEFLERFHSQAMPGNLNTAESRMLRVFNPETGKMEWITSDMFDPERHQRFPGNLNTAESDLLEKSALKRRDSEGFAMQKYLRRIMESGDTTLRDMISSLSAAGVPIRDIVKQVQQYIQNPKSIMSSAEGRFEGSPHSEGPFWRQFNKGGIVSLKHLTRPLKV